MKLESHKITTPAREIKRIVLKSLTPRFPNETSILAMKGDFDLSELEHGLTRVEKLRSDSSRSAPSHALAVAHAGGGQTGTGGGARGRGRQGRRSGGRYDDGRGRHQQGHSRQMHHGQQHQLPAAMSQQSYAWQQQQQQHYQPQFPTISRPTPGAAGEDRPTSSGEEERTTSVHHDIGEEIRLTSSERVMCQQCGEEEHFPADCVITMPAPTPHSYTNHLQEPVPRSTVLKPMSRSTALEPMSRSTALTPFLPGHQSTPSVYGPPPESSQFCTCPADATAAQICRASTSAGASFGFRLELLLRAIPGSTGTIRASRRVFEFGFD